VALTLVAGGIGLCWTDDGEHHASPRTRRPGARDRAASRTLAAGPPPPWVTRRRGPAAPKARTLQPVVWRRPRRRERCGRSCGDGQDGTSAATAGRRRRQAGRYGDIIDEVTNG
jgi:hypothetical protein